MCVCIHAHSHMCTLLIKMILISLEYTKRLQIKNFITHYTHKSTCI